MDLDVGSERTERAFSLLLDLINEIQSDERFREVLVDLCCAETVETAADWHANMEQALHKLSVLGKSGAKVFGRTAKIKELVR